MTDVRTGTPEQVCSCVWGQPIEAALGQLYAGEETLPTTLTGILCQFWHAVCGQSSLRSYSCCFLVQVFFTGDGRVLHRAEEGRGTNEPPLTSQGVVEISQEVQRTGELVLKALHAPAMRLALAVKVEVILGSQACCCLPAQLLGLPSAIT